MTDTDHLAHASAGAWFYRAASRDNRLFLEHTTPPAEGMDEARHRRPFGSRRVAVLGPRACPNLERSSLRKVRELCACRASGPCGEATSREKGGEVSLSNEPRPMVLGPRLVMQVSSDAITTLNEVVTFARERDVALVDLKFTDLPISGPR
jgi:hypothetical protein